MNKTTKLTLKLAALAVAFAWQPVVAQTDFDDIYYNSSKEVKVKKAAPKKTTARNTYTSTVADYPSADSYAVGEGSRNIDVDAYNRRGIFAPIDSAKARGTHDNDFTYTRRIEKFHDSTIVDGSSDEDLKNAYYYAQDQAAQGKDVNIFVINSTPAWSEWWGSPYWSYSWVNPWYYGAWRPYYSWTWGWGYDPYWSWGPAWSWGWRWGPGWGYGPSWGWGYDPYWNWSWGWGPAWGYRPSTGVGSSRPHRPAVGNGTSGRRPGSYLGDSGRPGNMGRPGQANRDHFGNAGTSVSRPGYGQTGGSGLSTRMGRGRFGNSTGSSRNSYSTPSNRAIRNTSTRNRVYNRDTRSNRSYSQPGYSRPGNNGSSYRSSGGGSYRSSGGSFGGGGSRGGGGGSRGRH